MGSMENFSKMFFALTGFEPMPWQEALYARFVGCTHLRLLYPPRKSVGVRTSHN